MFTIFMSAPSAATTMCLTGSDSGSSVPDCALMRIFDSRNTSTLPSGTPRRDQSPHDCQRTSNLQTVSQSVSRSVSRRGADGHSDRRRGREIFCEKDDHEAAAMHSRR